MALGTETALIGNFRHGVFPAFQQFGGTIEFIGTEEVRGCLACQTFDLIVELRTGDKQQFGDAGYVEF